MKLVAVNVALVACLLSLDQWTKRFFFSQDSGTIAHVPAFLVQITHHKNLGLTFDLPFPSTILIGLSSLIILGVLYAFIETVRHRERQRTFALSLILAGALGNLFDRLLLGFVRDWILLFFRSALNLADIFILVGILWFCFELWNQTRQETLSTDLSK